MTITYKIPVERLLENNKRSTLLTIIPNEVKKYETHKKVWGKESI